MDTPESPQAAAQRVAQAQRVVEQGEQGLRLLRQSRAAFIHSLRATGLTYAQARIKYDNCLEEQRRLHQAAVHDLQYAERRYQSLSPSTADA
ncbi:hypothetical protein [Bordetella petrii]|uniref:hypothetical protein n=1 Tax=Bordetella petrii TaxID=94624 RepID=UPI001A963E23|nr:hypothetical protein [Bordetella petrii]MBO1113378.1 hypothetical protein [Bordetella petrii]